MDLGSPLESMAYGIPLVVFLLACGLIGLRFGGWRGLTLATAVLTFLLCFGRAYRLTQAAVIDPGLSDLVSAMIRALVPVALCFLVLHEAKQPLIDAQARYGKWPAIITACASILVCFWVPFVVVGWSYGRLFPLDELTLSLAYWTALSCGAAVWGMQLGSPSRPSE